MQNSSILPIKRALLSVSDKTGLLNLASELIKLDIELITTGGTANILREAGFSVREVSEITGFPEIMNGRVKTLHPEIHGALLGRHDLDTAVMAEHNIQPIDLLVVNLYPFEEKIADPRCTMQNAVENIDIGGPGMIRAAAKNHERVTVVVDPADYTELINKIQQRRGTSLVFRQHLAAKAYACTARYDAVIAQWLSVRNENKEDENCQTFPPHWFLASERKMPLRYGENPHQKAALYVERNAPAGNVATARLVSGKELSFNNITDADTAFECVKLFAEGAACVIVKHANPCGVALGNSVQEAYERAFATDPTSAFGGIIAFNRPLDRDTAQAVLEKQFVEVIICPEVEKTTLDLFSKKPNVRLLETGKWPAKNSATTDLRSIMHGLLAQETDRDCLLPSDLRVVSRRKPNMEELRDLLFAWRVAMFVKSNAIVYVRDGQTLGIGAGQASRVMSAKIAGLKAVEAGLKLAGSVMASDAFFPFRDGIDTAAEAGARAIIQPGGSVRDKEIIAAADEHNMTMVFTGVRHFRH